MFYANTNILLMLKTIEFYESLKKYIVYFSDWILIQSSEEAFKDTYIIFINEKIEYIKR